MHIDASKVEAGTRNFDICIIGGGAAGITLARELSSSNTSVGLLEGGDLELKTESQDVYKGKAEGTVFTNDDPYLAASRLRFLGGTTNHWRGWCLPLEEIDFEKRSWVDHSGWPITRAELSSYYDRALSVVEIADFNYKVSDVAARSFPLILEKSSVVETRLFHRSAPTRFGSRYRDDLLQSPQIELLTNANVVELLTNEASSVVSQARVKTYRGTEFRVAAQQFILASGGVENARLMLASNSQHKAGIGNQNDVVGRYFADHPQIPLIGHVFFSHPKQSIFFYGRREDSVLGHDVYGAFCFSKEAQQEHQLLNSSFFLSPPLSVTSLTDMTKTLAANRSRFDVPEGSQDRDRLFVCPVRAAFEQTPNPESRVTLDTEKDRFGSARAKLNWQIPLGDNRNIRKAFELFSNELGRYGLGRGKLVISDDNPWPEGCSGGSHHIGTTRMHQDPRQGVVDANCKVHGMENLHVAGSSVFPTIGFANPTLTITALALRLAEHLKTKVLL